jgi:hypothetical protein
VMVTVGRLSFAQIARAFPTPRTYHLLPFVLAGSFVVIALLPHGSTAGGVVLFGVAAFGAGPLQSAGVSLSTIFGFTAIIAVALGVLSFVLARPDHRVHHLHPRPAGHLHTEAA